MSCLFVSLSHFLKKDSSTIRDIICNYLETNGKIIEDLDTDLILSLDNSKDEYIKQMRMSSTWGGGIEIKAACNIWNVRILIHNIRDINNVKIIEFLPINPVFKHTINLTWNGSHYEPISI
jgi:hypothetical protein